MSIKTKTIEYVDLWNDDYEVRLYFKEKEPEVVVPIIPTNISLEHLSVKPNIPTNLKVTWKQ